MNQMSEVDILKKNNLDQSKSMANKILQTEIHTTKVIRAERAVTSSTISMLKQMRHKTEKKYVQDLGIARASFLRKEVQMNDSAKVAKEVMGANAAKSEEEHKHVKKQLRTVTKKAAATKRAAKENANTNEDLRDSLEQARDATSELQKQIVLLQSSHKVELAAVESNLDEQKHAYMEMAEDLNKLQQAYMEITEELMVSLTFISISLIYVTCCSPIGT